MQLEDQLQAGKEAERLLQAIGLDAAFAEKQLGSQARPSKRLRTARTSQGEQDTVHRVRKLLNFLVAAKKELEEERHQLLEKILAPQVISLGTLQSRPQENIYKA